MNKFGLKTKAIQEHSSEAETARAEILRDGHVTK